MYIAQAKRKENIAEYILLPVAVGGPAPGARFSPEAIWSQLVAPQIPGDEERQNNLLMWYMDVGSLLREEGKEKTGHLDHTLHLIGDLNNLHEQCSRLQPESITANCMPVCSPNCRVCGTIGRQEISDTELAFRTLYAAMLYRMKGTRQKRTQSPM